jgi:hypothetical protein
MDLQIDVAAALKAFARDAKITLEGHHDVTDATGRPDSVYGSVIVEYKDPGTLSPNKDAAPNKAVIDQLKRRFYDMNREERRNWNSMFGVGTDGKYFIFLRFRDDKWTDQEPLEVNRYSTERFLWALYNLGQKGKPYQPEYLHGDFGSDSGTSKRPPLSAGSKCYNRPRSADAYMTLGEKRSGIAPEGKEPQSNPAGHGITLLLYLPFAADFGCKTVSGVSGVRRRRPICAFPGIPGLGYLL